MLLKILPVSTVIVLSGCLAKTPPSPDVGVLVLTCSGQWGGTGVPDRPETYGYRINFDARTIEIRDVRLGTWHPERRGQRIFHADANMISFDGEEPSNPLSQLHTTYTLQFDRQDGRVVDSTRLYELAPGKEGETVEEAFQGTCQESTRPVGQKKF